MAYGTNFIQLLAFKLTHLFACPFFEGRGDNLFWWGSQHPINMWIKILIKILLVTHFSFYFIFIEKKF